MNIDSVLANIIHLSENDYGFIWDIAELEADSSFVGKAVPDRDVVTVERSQM